jgi:tRNA (cmo5U34)-methyltransferase
MQTRDEVIQDSRWSFDAATTDAFDDMLARSIPQYEVMRRAVFDVACRFVRPNHDVVDLGCSRGEALAPFVERYGAQNRFVGAEVSPPMLEAVRKRFDGYVRAGVVDIRECDLRRSYPPVTACVTLSVLTLQFTPIEYRQKIVSAVYRHTAPGGAFVLVEKVIGSSAETDSLMTDIYLNMKSSNGYSEEQIERKRLSLEGVLVPVTSRWNEDMLGAAGFRHVECFWRWMNFAAWIAVRE